MLPTFTDNFTAFTAGSVALIDSLNDRPLSSDKRNDIGVVDKSCFSSTSERLAFETE
jgi:hypothetical protein